MFVKETITAFLKNLQTNPLQVYSEADLQSLLAYYLMQGKPEFFETSMKNEKTGDFHKTTLIHREYPYFKILNEDTGIERTNKPDIVVFSEKDVININIHLFVEDNISNNIRSVHCSDIIELKVKRGETMINAIKEDFNRLCLASEYYQGFKPNLFSIGFSFWKNPKPNKLQEELENISILIKQANEKKINFFLIIGPESDWGEQIHNSLVLKDVIDKFIFLH